MFAFVLFFFNLAGLLRDVYQFKFFALIRCASISLAVSELTASFDFRLFLDGNSIKVN